MQFADGDELQTDMIVFSAGIRPRDEIVRDCGLIVGDRNGIPKVASPSYKQNFNLQTGQCFDDETISIPTFAGRVVDRQVQVSV